MNLKKFFTIFSLMLLLMLCISAISAVSDENINNTISNFDGNQDHISVNDEDAGDNEGLSDIQDDDVLKKTNDDEIADDGTDETVSPYQKFVDDLSYQSSSITLIGDFSVNDSFIIKHDVVIDGNGCAIDGQHKTNIFKAYNCKLTVKNLIFVNGMSDKGGAIYCNGDLVLEGCTFRNNQASIYGGAVLQMYGGLTVINCLFEKNTVTSTDTEGNGGAIWTHDSTSSISKSTFKSNEVIANSLKSESEASKYKFNGGAITYKGGSHSLTQCTFSSNKASNYGGAIFVKSNLNIDKCSFNSNMASFEDGGAIYSIGDLLLDGCVLSSNQAHSYGGAVLHKNGKLTVRYSKFQSNIVTNSMSSGYGGAIWTYASSSSISNTDFKSNGVISKSLKKHSKATKYKFNGGAITYSAGSTHTLTQCTFSGNKASNHGGAIFVYKSESLNINNCKFNNNKACFEDGGAISFAGKKLSVSKSTFKKNLAYEDGGALDCYSLTGKKIVISIKNSVFTANTAYKGGGAAWLGVKTVVTFQKNKFTKNKASLGGAIVAETGSAKMTKCTFTSNKAAKITSWNVKTKYGAKLNHCGGAIFIEKDSCIILKCTIKNNKATYGGGVYFNAGKLTFKGNKVSGNKASKYGTQFFAKKSLKLSNANKWGPKKLSTKKAIKTKNMFGGSARA